ncbi:MAG: ATP-binding cassette domain-containing protein [Spirochaetaceae bacterium]|jgi:ABC-2 type transport system ATP-binding protein|nr:ATP-binding cassette domain-containing protein [Spirochaetaceae bacterium]
MEESIVVKTQGLGKKYGVRYAVLNLNVEIRRGQIYGFIGQNGAGKTTFIRMLTGLIAPTDGQIELFGESGERALQKARRRIGSIVETPALFPSMTARQNLETQARLLGLADNPAVIGEALESAGLDHTGAKKVKDFSLGMRQRIALVQAMLANPEFLVLDEPVNGLDPKGIIENRELLKRLVREKGMTILISSHILSELALLATDYGIIDNGRLIKQIGAEELQRECRQCIRLLTDETEKAVSFLTEHFHVKDMETAGGGAGKEIRIFEQLDHIALMNRALCEADIPVSSISMEGQDLESYFIKLTGGQPTGGVA